MDVIKDAIPLLNVGDGSSFSAVASVAVAIGGVAAAAAFLGLALTLVRMMVDSGDERGRSDRLRDAARIPMALLAIGFVLCAGGGVYLAVNANSAQDGIESQAAQAVTDASSNPGVGDAEQKLESSAFVPTNSAWKNSVDDSKKGKDENGHWNWANNPDYPDYDFKSKFGNAYVSGYYELDGDFVYKVNSDGTIEMSKRVPLPSEFK